MNHQHRHGSIFEAACACLLSLPLACSSAGPSTEASSDLGTLQLELTAPDQTGRTYRLRDAEFVVTPTVPVSDAGPGLVLSSESDPDEARLVERLLPGNYFVELRPGWRMEDVTHAPVDVPAVLLSNASVFFSIRRFSTTFVNYQFGVNGEPLAFGGDLSIGISVVSADAGTN